LNGLKLKLNEESTFQFLHSIHLSPSLNKMPLGWIIGSCACAHLQGIQLLLLLLLLPRLPPFFRSRLVVIFPYVDLGGKWTNEKNVQLVRQS
jgi:hypothetical protein